MSNASRMSNADGTPNLAKTLLWGGIITLLCVVLLIGGCAGAKSFNRYQKRADAANQVRVTHTKIKVAQQQAQIVRAQIEATKAKAEQRYQESVGIKRAQDEIQKTLTPLYVQHEAIQAQERIAESGQNNTIIYTPSGTNGVPLVQDVTAGTKQGTAQVGP
jgi:succinate dehydrogenase/fumarate reductase flavoprotein subunit